MNTNKNSNLIIRHGILEDGQSISILLNEIIEIGGTTAYQTPRSAQDIEGQFFANSHFICLFVAETMEQDLVGFQFLERHTKLPDDWGSIATFAKIGSSARGIGTALFQQTLKFARQNNVSVIDATIRADNESGLRYYSKMGFEDYSTAKAVPLSDGVLVDRISKKYVM